ncbi:translation initiation factor IF-2-like [Peromyscus leucopus]|uniref:translation initiation factor IF-2-like n=1 Tax=Peromyscus leucopus TaxID=10041 RepID=UPI0018851F90|nr:translation initiation factor IF-2-like [Peromyscus leucopus]
MRGSGGGGRGPGRLPGGRGGEARPGGHVGPLRPRRPGRLVPTPTLASGRGPRPVARKDWRRPRPGVRTPGAAAMAARGPGQGRARNGVSLHNALFALRRLREAPPPAPAPPPAAASLDVRALMRADRGPPGPARPRPPGPRSPGRRPSAPPPPSCEASLPESLPPGNGPGASAGRVRVSRPSPCPAGLAGREEVVRTCLDPQGKGQRGPPPPPPCIPTAGRAGSHVSRQNGDTCRRRETGVGPKALERASQHSQAVPRFFRDETAGRLDVGWQRLGLSTSLVGHVHKMQA